MSSRFRCVYFRMICFAKDFNFDKNNQFNTGLRFMVSFGLACAKLNYQNHSDHFLKKCVTKNNYCNCDVSPLKFCYIKEPQQANYSQIRKIQQKFKKRK